jgi:hypothetical protein
VNGVGTPPNFVTVGPFTIPAGKVPDVWVMIRNIDTLSRGWGNPNIIPAETYMWRFDGDGTSVDNVNVVLTNNSAVDGIVFDWAVLLVSM